MKKPIFLLLVIAALAWPFAGCSSTATGRAPHILETRVPFVVDLPEGIPQPVGLYDFQLQLSAVGLTAPEVRQILGHPAERVGDDLWIYWRYYSPEKAARETNGYDTLVVAFRRGKVDRMKLVSGDDLRARLEREPVSPLFRRPASSVALRPGRKP